MFAYTRNFYKICLFIIFVLQKHNGDLKKGDTHIFKDILMKQMKSKVIEINHEDNIKKTF